MPLPFLVDIVYQALCLNDFLHKFWERLPLE